MITAATNNIIKLYSEQNNKQSAYYKPEADKASKN
jgi:hypothetical protein